MRCARTPVVCSGRSRLRDRFVPRWWPRQLDGRNVLLFGDLTGWFYALDAATGKEIWRKRPEEHEAVRLSAPPVVVDGVAYVGASSWEESRALNPEYPCCTFRGSVTALRVRDGSVVWKTYTISQAPQRTGKTPSGVETWGPSGVGIWSTPTLDLKRRRLYVTTGNNYSSPVTTTSDAMMALDLDTGRMIWSKQLHPDDVYNSACSTEPKGPTCPAGSGPDYDFGSPAILVSTTGGRELLLAGQKSGIVWALDPEKNGEIMWETRVAQGGINGGVQWGMAADGEHVYAATSDVVVIRTPTARQLDPTMGGGLTALKIADGSKAWSRGAGAVRRAAPTAVRHNWRGHSDPGRRVLRVSGRSPARVLNTRRSDPLGLRHRAGLQDRERREGKRRRHRRPRARRRQRHGVRQLGLHALRRRAGQLCCLRSPYAVGSTAVYA